MTIEFFGDVDRNAQGEISSDMPAWWFDVHMEHLEEEVSKTKRQIKRGEIQPEAVPRKQQEIVAKEARIKGIKATVPKLNAKQRDMVADQYHKLQNEIARTMPTKRENLEGYTSPREELKRCQDFHISVDPNLAKACNVETNIAGKVSGDGANRMYRMMGRVLGENENVERIRREGRSESQKSMEGMTAEIIKKLVGAKG